MLENLLNTQSLLVELTAIRLAYQFHLDQMYAGVPNFQALAIQIVKGELGSYRQQNTPYTPTHTPIMVSNNDQIWAKEQRDAIADDTELMQQFAAEYGLVAYAKVKEGLPLAVALYAD